MFWWGWGKLTISYNFQHFLSISQCNISYSQILFLQIRNTHIRSNIHFLISNAFSVFLFSLPSPVFSPFCVSSLVFSSSYFQILYVCTWPFWLYLASLAVPVINSKIFSRVQILILPTKSQLVISVQHKKGIYLHYIFITMLIDMLFHPNTWRCWRVVSKETHSCLPNVILLVWFIQE